MTKTNKTEWSQEHASAAVVLASIRQPQNQAHFLQMLQQDAARSQSAPSLLAGPKPLHVAHQKFVKGVLGGEKGAVEQIIDILYRTEAQITRLPKPLAAAVKEARAMVNQKIFSGDYESAIGKQVAAQVKGWLNDGKVGPISRVAAALAMHYKVSIDHGQSNNPKDQQTALQGWATAVQDKLPKNLPLKASENILDNQGQPGRDFFNAAQAVARTTQKSVPAVKSSPALKRR